VSVVVEYDNGNWITKNSSHTYEQIKALLENNVPVTIVVTSMDGDAPEDHFGLVYTDSLGYGDYTYIAFRGMRQTPGNQNNYELYTLTFDAETGAFFNSKTYSLTPAT